MGWTITGCTLLLCYVMVKSCNNIVDALDDQTSSMKQIERWLGGR